MFFTVLNTHRKIPKTVVDAAYLIIDNWDDWGKFNTQYFLIYVDAKGTQHDVGSVKIGQYGMKDGQRRPEIPNSFDYLVESFFSVGQSQDYYETLNELGTSTKKTILQGLQDLVYDGTNLERALRERVTTVSLLRSVSILSIKGQFRRLMEGSIPLTRYKFSYNAPRPYDDGGEPLRLSFDVEPYVEPPTNIHVLIGSNGVGKSYCLSMMAKSLIGESNQGEFGQFLADTDNVDEGLFANVVFVSFSVFDQFSDLHLRQKEGSPIRYSYIGIAKPRHSSNDPNQLGRLGSHFKNQFRNAIEVCIKNNSMERLRQAIITLETDPLLRDYSFSTVLQREDLEALTDHAANLFSSLSSGHKIVLLTICKLVANVTERTLVLMDEPETHLHPPLLSSLIRAISNLLREQNGAAVIATHSPVVLQEVPQHCVWKLRKSGSLSIAERPVLETFGENVGILTREVFGLQVTQSGFHRMLDDAVSEMKDFDRVKDHFRGHLGAEAKAIVRGLIAAKKGQDDKSE